MEVVLRPVKVFYTNEKFSSSIGKQIGQSRHEQHKINWIEGDEGIGSIVMNGKNGKGVDIFFALQCKSEAENYVICVDQRKKQFHVSGNLLAHAAKECFDKADMHPSAKTCCKNILVRGLASNLLSFSGRVPYDNCFMISYLNSVGFHSGLSVHPAVTGAINVNSNNQTALAMLISGPQERRMKVSRLIMANIKEHGFFHNLVTLKEFLVKHNLKINEEESLRINF